MEPIKKQYNKLVLRLKKALDYMDHGSAPVETKEKYIPAFRELLSKMDGVLAEMKAQGIEWTEHEALNGFEVIE
jgi:hypothetical protein